MCEVSAFQPGSIVVIGGPISRLIDVGFPESYASTLIGKRAKIDNPTCTGRYEVDMVDGSKGLFLEPESLALYEVFGAPDQS